MIYFNKIVFGVLFVSMLIIPASADMFNETVGPMLGESTDFARLTLMSLAGLFVLVCAGAMLFGAMAKKRSWVTMGAEGFGLLVGVAVIFYIATSLFEYLVGKYW